MITLASIAATLSATCGVAGAWLGLAELERVARGSGGPVARLLSSENDSRRDLALVTAAGVAAAWIAAGAALAVAVGVAGPSALVAGRRLSASRRQQQLAAVMPAVARAVADGLSAGRSLPAAIAGASDSAPPPVQAELTAVRDALTSGALLEPSLGLLASRANDPGWTAAVCAMTLMHQVGGDLAGLLRRLAREREEELRAEAEARAALAQARATARLVGGVPIATAIGAEVLSPGTFAAAASSPIAALLLLTAAVLTISAAAGLAVIARGVSAR